MGRSINLTDKWVESLARELEAEQDLSSDLTRAAAWWDCWPAHSALFGPHDNTRWVMPHPTLEDHDLRDDGWDHTEVWGDHDPWGNTDD